MTDKEIIKELKKDLIFVRNGGAITPILFDIEECLRQSREEGFKAGQKEAMKRILSSKIEKFGGKTEKEARDSFEDYIRADEKRRLMNGMGQLPKYDLSKNGIGGEFYFKREDIINFLNH